MWTLKPVGQFVRRRDPVDLLQSTAELKRIDLEERRRLCYRAAIVTSDVVFSRGVDETRVSTPLSSRNGRVFQSIPRSTMRGRSGNWKKKPKVTTKLRSNSRYCVTGAVDDAETDLIAWSEAAFSAGAFEHVISSRRLRGYYHPGYRFWQFFDPATQRGLQAMFAADSHPPWEFSSPLRGFLHWAYDH